MSRSSSRTKARRFWAAQSVLYRTEIHFAVLLIFAICSKKRFVFQKTFHIPKVVSCSKSRFMFQKSFHVPKVIWCSTNRFVLHHCVTRFVYRFFLRADGIRWIFWTDWRAAWRALCGCRVWLRLRFCVSKVSEIYFLGRGGGTIISGWELKRLKTFDDPLADGWFALSWLDNIR